MPGTDTAAPEPELDGGAITPPQPPALAGAPPDVIILLGKVADVMAAVADVTPTGYNEQQHYAYASDDDLIRAVRGELVARRLIVIPSTQAVYTRTEPRYDRQTGQVTGSTEHARLDLTYTITDADTGAALPVTVTGAGSDFTDKAIAKAQTSGLKAFIRQAFLLADAAAEAGAQPVRPSAGARPAGGSGDGRPATEAQAKMVFAKLKAAGVDDVEAALFAAVGKRDTRELTRGDVDAILNRLAKGPPVTPGPAVAPAPPPSDVPAPDLEAEQARYAAQQAEAGVDVDEIPF